MPHWTEIDLKQTRFYQDVFAEGRHEGEVTLILRQLHRRCGEVAPAVQERIMRLSLPQLETLGEALLEFGSVADLEQWLNQPTRAWHSSVGAKHCFSPSQALPGKAK